MRACPHCGFKPPAIYRYKLGDADVSTLLKIWHGVIEQGKNVVDVRNIDLSYTERSRTTQTRFHGLIAKARDSRGKHIPAHWLITQRGGKFLRGESAVPKYVWVQDNKVIPREKVFIKTKNENDLKFLKKTVARNNYKILENFGSDYEIKEDKLIEIKQLQPSFAI